MKGFLNCNLYVPRKTILTLCVVSCVSTLTRPSPIGKPHTSLPSKANRNNSTYALAHTNTNGTHKFGPESSEGMVGVRNASKSCRSLGLDDKLQRIENYLTSCSKNNELQTIPAQEVHRAGSSCPLLMNPKAQLGSNYLPDSVTGLRDCAGLMAAGTVPNPF